MKITTKSDPIHAALMPAEMESAPRPGPTVRSSITVSGAGNAPARSRIARSFADCAVKLPEIWPEPARIGSRITGAEITLLSSTIAKGLPTLSRVAFAKRREPALLKRKFTTHSPVRWSVPGCASIRSSPATTTRFSMTKGCPSFEGSTSASAGGCACACCTEVVISTIRNVSLAVWPIRSIRRFGLSRPGTCTRMRSRP